MKHLGTEDRVIQESGDIKAILTHVLDCLGYGKFIGKLDVEVRPDEAYTVKIGLPSLDKPLILSAHLPLEKAITFLINEIKGLPTYDWDMYTTYLNA